MNLSHVMVWHEEVKVFRCRTSACCYEITWERLKEVGYFPRKNGTVFVCEDDFNKVKGSGRVSGVAIAAGC